ncbi:MAG: PEGA domain-containing protein [candidate division Zixibacteria bacterium]|nr:PEGA domain-containing protein [candidate division Zixibacteria bacterium]
MRGAEDSGRGSLRARVIVAVLLLLALVYFATDLRWAYGPLGRWAHNRPGASSRTYPYAVESVPAGAQVYVNNTLVGTTPYGYDNFEPGPLRLRLEVPGLAPVETVLIVTADAPPPVFPPFVFNVRLNFQSVPDGARPIVNGGPLRPYDAVNYSLRATDTISVQYELNGERSSTTARINPVAGLLGETDPSRWQWRPFGSDGPAQLTGIIARSIYVASVPPGAEVYLDQHLQSVGRTNGTIGFPYGDHQVRFVYPPFEEAHLFLTVSRSSPDTLAFRLTRMVHLAAFDAEDTSRSLEARLSLFHAGEDRSPVGQERQQTPGTASLDAQEYVVQFECKGYADTAVTLASIAGELTVGMRPLRDKSGSGELGQNQAGAVSVRFIVRQDRNRPLSGAHVIGIEKSSGQVVRYGPTDQAGELLTYVPAGNYEWRASKDGFTAKPNGERVKPGGRVKEISLRVKPH